MSNKCLLIIDAQNDFIDGSLKVSDAKNKMDNLAKYISENSNKYKLIILTVDWHPFDHSSFIENNGEWPKHCIQHTVGAAIYQPIIDAIGNTNSQVLILEKGNVSSKEEYSVMDNYFSSSKFLRSISDNGISQIDVCGIANEYCVLNTVKDLNEKINIGDKLNILFNFVSAITNEKVLKEYAIENKLKFE